MKIHKLPQNKNKSFVGVQMTGKGFVLSKEKAKELIEKDFKNSDCLKNFLIGRDINQNWEMKPSRQIIDFNDWPLEKASKYKDLIQILDRKVKHERQQSTASWAQSEKLKKFWWQYQSLGINMKKQIEMLNRFIVTSRVSKTCLFYYD